MYGLVSYERCQSGDGAMKADGGAGCDGKESGCEYGDGPASVAELEALPAGEAGGLVSWRRGDDDGDGINARGGEAVGVNCPCGDGECVEAEAVADMPCLGAEEGAVVAQCEDDAVAQDDAVASGGDVMDDHAVADGDAGAVGVDGGEVDGDLSGWLAGADRRGDQNGDDEPHDECGELAEAAQCVS